MNNGDGTPQAFEPTSAPSTATTAFIEHDSDGRPYAWMLSAAFFFAIMVALAHDAAKPTDWPIVAFSRASLVFVFALLLAVGQRVQLVVFSPRILWLRSLAGSTSMVCTFYAVPRLPISEALTLFNSYPLWILILSWIAGVSRPRLSDALAVACGVAGVAIIAGLFDNSGIQSQQSGYPDGRFAVYVALAGSITTATAMLGLHRLKQVNPQAVVVHFSGVATLVTFAALAINGFQSVSVLAEARTSLLLLGVGLAATVGQLCLTFAYTTGSPARVSVVGLTQVVFGIVLDVLLHGRQLEAHSVVGFAMVVLPSAYIMWTDRRANRRAAITEPAAALDSADL